MGPGGRGAWTLQDLEGVSCAHVKRHLRMGLLPSPCGLWTPLGPAEPGMAVRGTLSPR